MSVAQAVLPLLDECPFFGAFDEGTRRACAERFRELHFHKGQMIFARGDMADQIHMVASGQIRLAIGTSAGRELSFQIVSRGELFGEIGVLDGRPRSAEAIAIEPAVTYALDRSEFNRLRAEHSGMSDAIIVFLCNRLRMVSDKLEFVALYTLEARLARFLLNNLVSIPETPGRRTPIELGYSQSEMAQLLSASRPKLNLALAALERAGAIKRTADRLFCDRDKLAAIAEAGG